MYFELMGVKYNLVYSVFHIEVDLDGALVAEIATELKVMQRYTVVHWLHPTTPQDSQHRMIVNAYCCCAYALGSTSLSWAAIMLGDSRFE